MEQKQIVERLTQLRFPLIVLVVMIHSFSELSMFVEITGYNEITTFPMFFISRIIAAVAVPLFFAISGYMYFYRVEEFDKDTYFSKSKRRVKSLVIPYICWNLIVFAVYFLGNKFAPGMMKGGTINFQNLNFMAFLDLFWKGNSGSPLCYQMWFIRDLICVVFITPIVFLGLKRLRICFPLLLVCAWILSKFGYLVGDYITAIAFFTIGAYFSYYKVNLQYNNKVKYSIIGIYAIVSVLVYFIENLSCFNILLGLPAFYAAADICIGHKMSKILTQSSFFIFALHGLVMMIVVRVTKLVILNENDINLLACYFLNPLLTILICLACFLVIRKIKWLGFLSGGR